MTDQVPEVVNDVNRSISRIRPPISNPAFSGRLKITLEKSRHVQQAVQVQNMQIMAAQHDNINIQLRLFQDKNKIQLNIADLMEDKLQCCICREYLIKTTILNCSHVYCKLCIEQWMKVKKSCPTCRTPIKFFTGVTFIDEFIESLVLVLGEEVMRKRADALELRKAEQNQFDSESGYLHIFMEFLRTRSCERDVGAAIRQVVEHTHTYVHTGCQVLGRTLLQTNEVVRTRTATAKQHLTTAVAYAGAEIHTKTQQFYASAIYRRAVALAKAADLNGAKELTKSAVVRKVAALSRVVALAGKKKTKLFEDVAVLAKGVNRFEVVKRISELAKTAAKATGKHPTVSKAMTMLKAGIAKGSKLKKTHIVNALNSCKATALMNVRETKRFSRHLIAMTNARLASLKTAVTSRMRVPRPISNAARAQSRLISNVSSINSTCHGIVQSGTWCCSIQTG